MRLTWPAVVALILATGFEHSMIGDASPTPAKGKYMGSTGKFRSSNAGIMEILNAIPAHLDNSLKCQVLISGNDYKSTHAHSKPSSSESPTTRLVNSADGQLDRPGRLTSANDNSDSFQAGSEWTIGSCPMNGFTSSVGIHWEGNEPPSADYNDDVRNSAQDNTDTNDSFDLFQEWLGETIWGGPSADLPSSVDNNDAGNLAQDDTDADIVIDDNNGSFQIWINETISGDFSIGLSSSVDSDGESYSAQVSTDVIKTDKPPQPMISSEGSAAPSGGEEVRRKDSQARYMLNRNLSSGQYTRWDPTAMLVDGYTSIVVTRN
ncbi:hypothetical protein BJ085DRAFT_32216 [Dimargaris cristalligena]|uniref:Uncharacterized protein n=1 Tax=Dimargaris cristalligena TaxID=215637 RepID=A0A4P9ZTL9_9FUNG|nr:hypothetical protein BJ085DRAFT_32216 [Dimargaris cristalligena]|eukprot:RKP36827.1 hypothetical protein BJ085DRAFT_32216 [Dimargaris cristalligena]